MLGPWDIKGFHLFVIIFKIMRYIHILFSIHQDKKTHFGWQNDAVRISHTTSVNSFLINPSTYHCDIPVPLSESARGRQSSQLIWLMKPQVLHM